MTTTYQSFEAGPMSLPQSYFEPGKSRPPDLLELVVNPFLWVDPGAANPHFPVQMRPGR